MPEHRRRDGRRAQALDGVLSLGGLAERGSLDVALFQLRSLEQYLAGLRAISTLK